MIIESTKKIIASIILAIMLLGITTPTFAATKGFDFGNAMAGLTQAATGVFGIVKEVTPEIGKFATDTISKVDTSRIGETLSGFANSIGINENKGSNSDSTKSILGIATDFGTSILSNTFNGFFKNEDKSAEDKKQFSITNIFEQKEANEKGTGIFSAITEKIENSVKEFEIPNIFGQKDNEERSNKKETGIFSAITEKIENSTGGLNIFKNMFKKDNPEPGVAGVTAELGEETDGKIGTIENVVNKLKTETETFFSNIKIEAQTLFLNIFENRQDNQEEVTVESREDRNDSEERNVTIRQENEERQESNDINSTLEMKIDDKYDEYKNYSREEGGNFSKNQCTWWAYCRASDYLGEDYSTKGGNGNHAYTWDNNTKFETGTEPRPNSIGVYEKGEDGASAVYGHVVYVEGVTEDGTVYISQCNYGDGSRATYNGVRDLSTMPGKPSTYIYLDRPIE